MPWSCAVEFAAVFAVEVSRGILPWYFAVVFCRGVLMGAAAKQLVSPCKQKQTALAIDLTTNAAYLSIYTRHIGVHTSPTFSDFLEVHRPT
jgi:hypothetical protein